MNVPAAFSSPHALRQYWPPIAPESIRVEYPDHKTVRIHEPKGTDATEAVRLLIDITGGEVEVKRRTHGTFPVTYTARSKNLAMLFKLAYGGAS